MAERLPKLANLREPPVVGRYYLVPTVEYLWLSRLAVWPVSGPLHHDREINFPWLHFHIDGRFLTARQRRWLADYDQYSPFSTLNGRPMSEISRERWAGLRHAYRPLPRRPTLRKRLCTSSSYSWTVPRDATEKLGLEARYPLPVAIHKADGRQLCPHRKVDLSQFAEDADGLKTCPLHGLRVDCRRSAA